MRRPFVTALGRKRVSRNLQVFVRLDDGAAGYGEASSSLAWPEDTPEAMAVALRRAVDTLIGQPIRSYRRLVHQAWEAAGAHPTAAAALECALLDAHTRSRRTNLWRWLGARRRTITTGLTLSAWPPGAAARAACIAYARGFRNFKVKVMGYRPDEDLRRLLAVHRAAPRARLIADGNQGFTAARAVRLCEALRARRLPVILFEQPVPRRDWDGLAEVQRKGGIPVAADESARSAEEARRLIRRKTVPVINVKVAKTGLLGVLEIIRAARRGGVRLMIGCMAESARGLYPSVALACGTGSFDYVDLDSHLLAAGTPGSPGFTTRGPQLRISHRH